LHLHLDHDGGVLQMAGPLRHLLAQQPPHDSPLPLAAYLLAHSTLAIEGRPQDWQGQMLDLDFPGLSDQTLHLRGWVQPSAAGWVLQLMDIGDLLLERQQSRHRESCQALAGQISDHLRTCSLMRLPVVLSEQLQAIAQRWRIPCLAIALLDEQAQGWQIFQHYRAHDAPRCGRTASVWARRSTASTAVHRSVSARITVCSNTRALQRSSATPMVSPCPTAMIAGWRHGCSVVSTPWTLSRHT
jgi:hypothetical protein